MHVLFLSTLSFKNLDKELEQQQRALDEDGKEQFLDPLGAASPLSFERTSATLSKFKTDARLSLQNSFLYFPEGTDVDGKIVDSSKLGQKQLLLSSVISGKNKRQVKEQSTPSIKFVELTQEEWCRKLGEFRFRLKVLWREEKRLDCIKLISELLAQLGAEKTTCSAQFYLPQFVYITDLLDFFGRLVWLRLLQCAQEERRQAGLGDLPLEWNIGDILVLAAILPCQRFMDPWPQVAGADLHSAEDCVVPAKELLWKQEPVASTSQVGQNVEEAASHGVLFSKNEGVQLGGLRRQKESKV
uniref:UDENN domain-containing protein n=1 Tax=Meloidogyne hapla TaxID=6305 RepID=A0A1I8B992_MELHA